jgi:hypothetical protein
MIFFCDSSRQALIFVDPETRRGIGFFVPDVEKADFWEPKGQLEVSLRKSLPPMPGQSQIVSAPAGLNVQRRR